MDLLCGLKIMILTIFHSFCQNIYSNNNHETRKLKLCLSLSIQYNFSSKFYLFALSMQIYFYLVHIMILIAARQLLAGNSHYHRSITLFSFVDAAQHRSVTDPSSYRVCLCSQSPSIPPCVSDVLVWSQRARILIQDILTVSDTDSSVCIHRSFLARTGAQGVTMWVCSFVPAVLSC